MFDVGFWELLLIGVVTLLVVGPDRLPEVARTAGKWVLKARRFVAGVKSDFQTELESGELHKILGDQKEQIKELRSMVDTTRKEIESSTTETITSAKAQFESIEKAARDSDSKAAAAVIGTTNAIKDVVDPPAAAPEETTADQTSSAASTENSNNP